MTDKSAKNAQDVFWTWGGHERRRRLRELRRSAAEDKDQKKNTAERTAEYVELGKKWSAGHKNRLIKVPATPGGLAAIEELVAAGVNVNITLIFSERQYKIARDAVYRAVQRRSDKENVKTVYSIFVSRVDVYTEDHVPDLSPAAQGLVGIVNAKRIWKMNRLGTRGWPASKDDLREHRRRRRRRIRIRPNQVRGLVRLVRHQPTRRKRTKLSPRAGHVHRQVDQMPPLRWAEIDAEGGQHEDKEVLAKAWPSCRLRTSRHR